MLIDKLLNYINKESWKQHCEVFPDEIDENTKVPKYRYFPIDEFNYIQCKNCIHFAHTMKSKNRCYQRKNVCSYLKIELLDNTFYCKDFKLNNTDERIILGYTIKYTIFNDEFTEFFPFIDNKENTLNAIKQELGNKEFEIVDTIFNLTEIEPIGFNKI